MDVLDDPSEESQRLTPLNVVVLSISVVAFLYCIFADAGPFRWMTEAGFSDKFSFTMTLLVIFLPLHVLTLPLRFLNRGIGWKPPFQITRIHRYLLAIPTIGLTLIGLGAHDYWAAHHGTKLIEIDARVLDAGQDPPSTWVRVTGYPEIDAAVSYGKPGSFKEIYVPVISSGPAKSIHLFLMFFNLGEWQSEHADELHARQFEGMLEHAELPGPVRVEFERTGQFTDDAYFVLHVGATPTQKLSSGKDLMLVGTVISVVSLAAFLFLLRRWRRSRKEVGSAGAIGQTSDAAGTKSPAAWNFRITEANDYDQSPGTVILYGKVEGGAMMPGDRIRIPTALGAVVDTKVIMICPVKKGIEQLSNARAGSGLLAVFVEGHGVRVQSIRKGVAEGKAGPESG